MNVDPVMIDCPIVILFMTIGCIALAEIIRNHFRHTVLKTAFYSVMLALFTILTGFFLFEPVNRFWYSPVLGVPLLRWIYLPATGLSFLFIARLRKTRHLPLNAESYSENLPHDTNRFSSVYETKHFYIIFPEFDRVRYSVGERPPQGDLRVTFCGTASFQKTYWGRTHSNIIGSHVCDGILYEDRGKYPAWKKFGVFAFFHQTWHFAPPEEAGRLLAETVKHGGDAFSQYLLIHEGKQLFFMNKDMVRHSFRAIAQLDGRLCVIDCKHEERAYDFIRYLMELHVQEAIYVDLGAWMNTSWYRLHSGKKCQCFPFPVISSANLVRFQLDKSAQ